MLFGTDWLADVALVRKFGTTQGEKRVQGLAPEPQTTPLGASSHVSQSECMLQNIENKQEERSPQSGLEKP